MTQANQRLAGKTALVTGASAGIGWATAIALAQQGANLVVTARREERLRQLCTKVESFGAKAIHHAGDAAEESTAQQTVALALITFGHLDIVINNAGAGHYKNLVDTTVEDYDALMNANMRSSFLFSRHAAPHMIAPKILALLFICSVAGLQGATG